MSEIVPEELTPKRNVPALLGAVGLAHDLGNPPFGHQGEETIRHWFSTKQRSDKPIFLDQHELSDAMKRDFLKFEGNAQTLRLLTRLQILNDDFGLNLTYGTLAALMKYTVPSDKADKDGKQASSKKHGFFQSEEGIVLDIWKETGLGEKKRHPLTYVMEACDDIAYSILDTEDAVKKGLVSFSDVMDCLRHNAEGDGTIKGVIQRAETKYLEYRKEDLSPTELNDISMQMFRVYAIGAMVKDATDAFENKINKIMTGSFEHDLIYSSQSAKFREILKEFCYRHAFKHRCVVEIELRGHNIMMALMDLFWEAITQREKPEDVSSTRKTPFAKYAYSRISENYRRIFETSTMPVRYREAQLLTDMVSGMTDSYALALFEELKAYHEKYSYT